MHKLKAVTNSYRIALGKEHELFSCCNGPDLKILSNVLVQIWDIAWIEIPQTGNTLPEEKKLSFLFTVETCLLFLFRSFFPPMHFLLVT